MAVAYIGIGSNIGQREKNFKNAIKRLDSTFEIKVVERSSFYLTKPVGGPHQADYLNGVVKIETRLDPEVLLKHLKQIELDMGRVVSEKDHPRIIDLDILLFEDRVIKKDFLEVPHSRMHKRTFVLKGLNEIAPDVIHPVLGQTISELYENN